MKVVFVLGPTASGKSQAAIEWAREFNGVIVNCDSVQCYQRLDIGSAKPSKSERELCPHYLFDDVPVGTTQTAGDYHRKFYSLLAELSADKNVFVVGGTGFYFQAIEKGMFELEPVPPELRSAIEAELKDKGLSSLYGELVSRDPEAAAKISRNDPYRIVRALELLRTQGLSLSQIQDKQAANKKPFPYPLLKIGFWGSRDFLLPRVKVRTEKMLQEGLVTETESLVEEGLQDWKALQSVGYKETVEYLLLPPHQRNLSELKEKIIVSTLQLAKRQRTWFQRDPEIYWIVQKQDPDFIDLNKSDKISFDPEFDPQSFLRSQLVASN